MKRSTEIPNHIALCRELLVVPQMLAPDEEVVMEARASSPWSGLLALTTDRLLFIRWRILLSGFKRKAFRWDEVVDVAEAPNTRGAALKVTIAGRKRPLRLDFFFDKDRAFAIEREIRARMGHEHTS